MSKKLNEIGEMDKSYIIYPATFSALVFKVIKYWGHFHAVSLTSRRVKYICKFIFAASFKERKKIILKSLNSKVYKYYLVIFLRIFFESF